ncbi:MAG: hypothetical protein AAFN04_00130 [Pseudomonadota bacterium]
MTDTTDPVPQAPAPKGLSPRLQSAALLAEIIAALAIIVSLIFVGLQIQQNTQATRAASAFEVNRLQAQLAMDVSTDAPSALLRRKIVDPSIAIEDFTEEERARAEMLILSTVQGHFGTFRLYQEGSLLQRDWEVHGAWAAHFRRLPLVKRNYESSIAAGLYDADFIAELDRLDALIGEESLRLSDYATIENADEQQAEGEE